MIYFVQGQRTGMIKIGHSDVVKTRLTTLRTGSPERLRVLALMDGTRHDEQELHRRFAAHRSHGEWFHPRDELLLFIERLDPRPIENHGRSRTERRRARHSEAASRLRVDALQLAADKSGLTPREYVIRHVLAPTTSEPPSTVPSPATTGGRGAQPDIDPRLP